jgi:hypothetical protein
MQHRSAIPSDDRSSLSTASAAQSAGLDATVKDDVESGPGDDVGDQLDATLSTTAQIRRADVVVCPVAVVHGLRLVRAEHLRVEVSRQLGEVFRMPIVQHLALVAECGVAEVAHRVEQSVLGVVGRGVDDDQRLVDQFVEAVGDGQQIVVDVADDTECVGGVELAGEHGQTTQEVLQLRVEMLVRPLQRVVQDAVSLIDSLGDPEEAEALVEMPLDLLRRHRPHARRGQFDRQRDSVQPRADPRHDRPRVPR